MDILMVGDFNIDLFQDNCNRDKLIDSMVQLGFIQQVTLPTRVTDTSQSLIDHVYTKSKRTLQTDVITSNILDHFLTLITYPNLCSKRVKTSILKRWLTFDSYVQLQQLLKAKE